MTNTTSLPVTVNWDTNNARPHPTRHHTAVELGRDPDKDKKRRDPFLDTPSASHWITDRLFDRAMLTILMTADGATSSYAPTDYVTPRADRRTAKGRLLADAPRVKPARLNSSVDLVGASSLAALMDDLATNYASCSTHRARLLVVKRAQDEGMALKYTPKCDPRLIRGTREFREVLAHDPRPQRVVTFVYRVSSRTLTAARKEFGVRRAKTKEGS